MSEAMDRHAEPLKRGWTTGSCATGAAKAAFQALVTGVFPDPVAVTLPGGQQPEFALATTSLGDGWARAGIVKDAGDDPDVTHGATVLATVRPGPAGSGVRFKAGPEGCSLVFACGRPLHEEIAWGGPIVMNTQAELELAFREYSEGTFIKHRAT